MAEIRQRPEVLKTYEEYESRITSRHLQIGCFLVMALMPAGVLLDWFVYPDNVPGFLFLRLGCSLVAAGVLGVLRASPNLNQRLYPVIGLVIAILPVFSMCWMIHATEGARSPYYAGLNLVLLAVAFVMRWTVGLSVAAVLLTVCLYVGACLSRGPVPSADFGIFFNNLYFLSLTGIIVVVGSRIHRLLRVREYHLRFELDRNRQTLQEANAKLVELDQIKSRFFANISHELRTPLTLLLAPLESLLHARHRVTDPDTRSQLATMHANAMRLLKLINDLLDLVRMESGRMEVRAEPLEVHEFIKGLASAARQVAEDKRIRLETAVDPALGTVLADRDKLEKILLNLLFNALKFTPGGGRVELRADREGDWLRLAVADTGMGIAAKHLPHVFDRFWQADSSSKRKYQGAGIGLALVKELTEVQKGTVTVVSEEGKGTTFTVQLPYRQAESPAAERTQVPAAAAAASEGSAAASQSEEWLANLYRRAELFPALTPLQDTLRPIETDREVAGRPTALVADDEPDMLRFLKSQLAAEYRILEAVDGQQAIEKASQFLPDIILLDMMMPEKDGIQACKELRRPSATTQAIPIIMLTARADEETKLAALSAGASDFLSKPFSTTELHVRIRNLVEAHQLQRRLAKQNRVLEATIEQLKETETQLVQSAKLASLGRMSAGLIHEINNPLNFAATGLFTLRKQQSGLAADQQARFAETLRDVEDGLRRVQKIVTDLRAFTHPNTEQVDQVSLADTVRTALRFLSGEISDTVRIDQDLEEGLVVEANRNALIQVVLNLLQNSLDALKAKSFNGATPTIRILGTTSGGRALLVIRDNGTGIPADVLDKIFDPFFTTKDVGEGMGLGLSICYRIVQDYGGRIAVKTEPGQFAEFTLDFPAVARPAAAPAAMPINP